MYGVARQREIRNGARQFELGKEVKGIPHCRCYSVGGASRGSAFVRMEAHLDVSVTLEGQSEAHGVVGSVGGAPTHASLKAFEVFPLGARGHRRRGSIPPPTPFRPGPLLMRCSPAALTLLSRWVPVAVAF